MPSETMERRRGRPGDTRDLMVQVGGAALIAGLFATPKARKFISGTGLLLLGAALAPDFLRYMKIETM